MPQKTVNGYSANLPDSIKDEIVGVVNSFLPDNKILILFGSFAQDNGRRISDIDLALFTDKNLKMWTFFELKEYLNESIHTLRDIDLIRLDDNIPRDLMENILFKGMIWIDSKNLMNILKRRLKSMKK